MFDIGLARIAVEVVSAIICFILVKFMIKPFRLMGEERYLGLPLGFGFLGISYSIAALAYFEPSIFLLNYCGFSHYREHSHLYFLQRRITFQRSL